MRGKAGENQWESFILNARQILHNEFNLQKIQSVQALRSRCARSEIVCNLIK